MCPDIFQKVGIFSAHCEARREKIGVAISERCLYDVYVLARLMSPLFGRSDCIPMKFQFRTGEMKLILLERLILITIERPSSISFAISLQERPKQKDTIHIIPILSSTRTPPTITTETSEG